MAIDDIISYLTKNLSTKLQSTTKTGILDEITSRIGSLSNPSKMPGYGWSIPAQFCPTGSKLAKIKGTPCSKCYALKGRYGFPNVQNAMHKRFQGWIKDTDWTELMAIRLNILNCPFFRWFDSGDLQNLLMLQKINQIALWTKNVEHWLPTQERAIVSQLQQAAPNLTIRISSSKLDSLQMKLDQLTSSVSTKGKVDGVWNCPAKEQDNNCGTCRACWDKDIQHIVYRIH